jgi:hypothetical protein
VQVGSLVEDLGYGFARLGVENVPRFRTALRRYFPESGHTVSYAFLEFFRQLGGAETFGLPISEPRVEGGRTVQYFQNFRMEWHPEAQPIPEVRLGKLAAANLDRLAVPEGARAPLAPPPSAIVAGGDEETVPVDQLRVSASTESVVAAPGSRQTVHVAAHDPLGRPIEGATVDVVVRSPAAPLAVAAPATNGSGLTKVEFGVGDAQPGTRVIVDVVARYAGQEARTQTFFLVWH